MPIYEYACEACGHEFELLIRGETTPRCPDCAEERVIRKLSLPRVHSEASRERGLAAARKRDQAAGNDRMHERIEYESNHD